MTFDGSAVKALLDDAVSKCAVHGSLPQRLVVPSRRRRRRPTRDDPQRLDDEGSRHYGGAPIRGEGGCSRVVRSSG